MQAGRRVHTPDPDAAEATHTQEELAIESPLKLWEQRMGSVISALKAGGAHRVLDLGCGEGKLLHQGDFALPDMEQPQTLHADWAADAGVHHATLHVTLLNPRGESETEQTLNFLFPVASGQDIKDMTLPGVKP